MALLSRLAEGRRAAAEPGCQVAARSKEAEDGMATGAVGRGLVPGEAPRPVAEEGGGAVPWAPPAW